MDRQGRKALLAALALPCAAFALAAAAQVAPVPLRAAKWLAAKDVLTALSEQPAECYRAPADPDLALGAEIGRAVFRSPVLLGGQAAKAGVSCETCHRNGRGNPAFLFPGLSGEPGTADVTSSLMSSHRGDGKDNPKPIPDLGGPADKLKVSRAVESPDLPNFLRGIVTEEFDGEEPPPAVLAGLATYVRSVNEGACPVAAMQPTTAESQAEDVARAVRAAQGALAHGDDQTALAVLEAGRAMLFLIDERYAVPGLESERNLIRTASLDLGSAEGAIRRRAPARPLLDLWLDRYPVWKAQLRRTERRSLYDRGVLAASVTGAASTPTLAKTAN